MNSKDNHLNSDKNDKTSYRIFAITRISMAILLCVAILWALNFAINYFYPSGPDLPPVHKLTYPLAITAEPKHTARTFAQAPQGEKAPQLPTITHKSKTVQPPSSSDNHAPVLLETRTSNVAGIAFVRATIKPLDYELNKRFWGWRPNDILNFSDNVNNYQLGVLEVTRRTAVSLAERLSRTGSTAAFDRNLETAMNWFMIKADRYWFPSPETKYREGLAELKAYSEKLGNREANFYTRPDNLIPLLAAYEDLLGSCDENLVKTKEDDGAAVSFFRADNYFYYAQGVASAMGTILKAILEDFRMTLESRHGAEVLHHAIESCRLATEINPWLITEGGLSSILANHRANMAAPISHARFYIGVLIKTLST